MRMSRGVSGGIVGVIAVLMAVLLPASQAEAASQAVAAYPVQIVRAYYNSPGADTGTNTSLNAEWIQVKNLGSSSRSLSGWTLSDPQRHVYRFGTFVLGAGKTVTLHTGVGTNTSSNRYWGLKYYVWNNTGDTASLRTSASTLIDQCAWSAGLGYKVC